MSMLSSGAVTPAPRRPPDEGPGGTVGVPVVSARQLLEWLDRREGSSFASLKWVGDTLQFAVSVDPGTNNLAALLPMTGRGKSLTRLARDGQPVI